MELSRVKKAESEVQHLAVGVCRFGEGTHTGVVHREPNGTLRFLEQAFHYLTRNDPVLNSAQECDGPFLFVVPDLEADRARVVAAMCRLIASHLVTKKLPGLPYALEKDDGARFDQATGELMTPNGIGLSCSTFVIVVFRSCSIPFVDFNNWPKRPSDKPAHERLVGMLEKARDKGYASHEHVEKVRQQIGCVRARPEEIAGTCLLEMPGTYPQAEIAGQAVLSQLN